MVWVLRCITAAPASGAGVVETQQVVDSFAQSMRVALRGGR